MSLFEKLVYLIPGLVVALTFHEYAHALVAYKRGDDTAYRAGRLTLNPLVHLDPIGALLLLFVGFGWAKPVPVNPMNLANPKRDMVWVSLAGPISNMIQALILALIIRVIFIMNVNIGNFIITLRFAFSINLVLAVFNLIPLAPLDGHKIVSGLLPYNKSIQFEEATRRGPMILMGILILGSVTNINILGMIIEPWVHLWSIILLGSQITMLMGL